MYFVVGISCSIDSLKTPYNVIVILICPGLQSASLDYILGERCLFSSLTLN